MARGIKYATSDRVGTAALQQMFGASGAGLMAIAILISTFGCCNGLILSGARVYYAMAKDGLFFKSTGKVHPKYLTPKNALIVQGIWTCVLCLSGTYRRFAELRHFCRSGLLYIDDCRPVRFAAHASPRPKGPIAPSAIRCFPPFIL